MVMKRIRKIHEALGDEYLDTLRSHGVDLSTAPTVVWTTQPPTKAGETLACILWDDGEEWVQAAPRSILAAEVSRRVLARIAGRN